MGNKKRKMLGVAFVLTLASPWYVPGLSSAEVFELDRMKNLFEGVSFDHDMHVEVTEENCTLCHHHTAGTPPTDPLCLKCHKDSEEADSPACYLCHVIDNFSADNLKKLSETPFLYHPNRPGLKAAYHRNCLGCHQEEGAPTGCLDCHAMTDAGEKFYHTGKYAPSPRVDNGHGGGGH